MTDLSRLHEVARSILEEVTESTRLEVERLQRLEELAREAVDVWAGGPSRYDAEDFDVAMSALRAALPSKPHAPIESGPNDPF